MKKTLKLRFEFPDTLPHGWKSEVAKILGIHINTVTNALKKGYGDTYNRILTTAKNRYGKISEITES